MELFQLFWDNQRNLFLEFKKEQNEKQLFLPETVNRVNLQYEISKIVRNSKFQHRPLVNLISIKTLYFFDEYLAFSIDLSEISNSEDLQIKILNITIFLNSGQKISYSVSRTYILSEICINEEFSTNFSYEEVRAESQPENSMYQEKIYQEHKTDYKNNQETKTFIYEKNKVKTNKTNQPILSMIQENTNTMKDIVEQLKLLNMTLKNSSFNNISYLPSGPPMSGPPRRGIEPINRRSSMSPSVSIRPPGKMFFLPELKKIIEDNQDVKSILKPLTEEELKSITLDDEELEKKQEKAIQRQIKRLEKE